MKVRIKFKLFMQSFFSSTHFLYADKKKIIYAIFFPFWRSSYQSYKMDCCLTNTDAHVTSGSEDGFIFFWDLVDASVASSFKAHASVVKYSCLKTAVSSFMIHLLLIHWFIFIIGIQLPLFLNCKACMCLMN